MSGTDSDSDSSGGHPAPPSLTASGRPARGATGRDGRIAVAYSPLVVQATGRRRATPEAAAARDARREAAVAAAFEALVSRGGFQHTVLRDPRPGASHGAELGNVWTLGSLPAPVMRAVADALQEKQLPTTSRRGARPRPSPRCRRGGGPPRGCVHGIPAGPTPLNPPPPPPPRCSGAWAA
jgi:hypothetical protein